MQTIEHCILIICLLRLLESRPGSPTTLEADAAELTACPAGVLFDCLRSPRPEVQLCTSRLAKHAANIHSTIIIILTFGVTSARLLRQVRGRVAAQRWMLAHSRHCLRRESSLRQLQQLRFRPSLARQQPTLTFEGPSTASRWGNGVILNLMHTVAGADASLFLVLSCADA